MNRRFKKRRKLKKNISLFIKISLIFFLIIFMQNNNFLKHLFYLSTNKYIKNTYIEKENNLAMPIKEKIKENNNDEIFALKEEKNTEPLIYLYNTHQGEKYIDESSFKPTIYHATRYLSELLNKSDLYTIVENRSIKEVLDKNGWSYGSSYKVSRLYMEDVKNNHSSIKYFIDIHRDSGLKKYTTLCVDNKCYAKLLFLIGLENPNYMENQLYAETLSKKVNEKLSGLSKGILQKQGPKVNGIYNEDFSPRVILIEVGGENNTIEEVYNTLDILSEVLIDYIKEENNYGR